MKKVIFCAMALMMGTMLFAQHMPTPPTAPATVPNSSPNPLANTGKSIQNGNGQMVSVQQVGTKNSAKSTQDDGTGTGGNLAFIKQIGAVQPGISGEANAAEVEQHGSANQSTQIQEGDRNEALTQQGMNNAASSGNKAYTQQGTNEQAEDNKVQVVQDGMGNQARTKQTYDNNEALTVQNGDGNRANIRQIASPENSDGHLAEVNQEGDDNQGLVHQSGSGGENAATSWQRGDGNSTVQIQVNTSSAGNQNNAYVSQGDGYFTGGLIVSNLYWSGLDVVDDIDNGSLNSGSIDAIARQEQTGTNNVAGVYQMGEANQSYQKQTGDDNRGLIVQNAYGNPNGESNRARQVQNGSDNDAGIAQNGSDHKAYQTQNGAHNLALSTQRGHDNWANINQVGDNNWATTAQRGQCNQALVNQYDGQSYSVEQNLNGGLPGGHNVAHILQQGPGGANVGVKYCDVPDVDPGDFTPIDDLNMAAPCPGCGI